MAPDESGLRVAVTGARAPGLAAWLRRAAPARARGEVTVALVSDARVRAFNRRYRGKDYATDVLSFPAVGQEVAQPCATNYLGDIVIATGVARRQAADLGHSLAVELRILSLHGLLHLLGYDHERDRGGMRRLEQRLLRRSGLRDGLIARARPSAFAKAAADGRSAKRGGASTRSGRAADGKHARGEPFDSPLILSPSKDERLAQDRPVRGRALHR